MSNCRHVCVTMCICSTAAAVVTAFLSLLLLLRSTLQGFHDQLCHTSGLLIIARLQQVGSMRVGVTK